MSNDAILLQHMHYLVQYGCQFSSRAIDFTINASIRIYINHQVFSFYPSILLLYWTISFRLHIQLQKYGNNSEKIDLGYWLFTRFSCKHQMDAWMNKQTYRKKKSFWTSYIVHFHLFLCSFFFAPKTLVDSSKSDKLMSKIVFCFDFAVKNRQHGIFILLNGFLVWKVGMSKYYTMILIG